MIVTKKLDNGFLEKSSNLSLSLSLSLSLTVCLCLCLSHCLSS